VRLSVETPKNLDPNPFFSTEAITSTQASEAFIWLTARAVDSLTVDGHKLLSVDHVFHEQSGTVHIACSAEDGASHLFEFNELEEGPVSHLIVDAK
jgi:hypothetical protein